MLKSVNTIKKMSSKLSGKILCLHGFAQDAETFRAKSSGLRKALKKIGLETYYLNAPVKFVPADLPFDLSENELNKFQADANRKEYRGWWKKNEDKYDISEALESVRECCAEEGPFIGVLGFSQGAGLAGLLSSRFEELVPGHPALKFAIYFSGFKVTDNPKLEELYVPKISIPTLHILGELDTVVSSERTMKLFDECCEEGNATVYKHPGGHFVPNAKPSVEKVIAWIVNSLDEGKKSEPEPLLVEKEEAKKEEEDLDDILALIDKLGK